MAVTINIPSQVKTYANLAAFPASGSLKTIYIAEDTNKTYRWTGSVYVEVSASASGITIGSTAIASGVVGRVLFEGAGNVVQESSSLFWDNTNGTLEATTTSDNLFGLRLKSITGQIKVKPYLNPTYGVLMESKNIADSAYLPFTISGSRILLADGNVLINTTTDAGFKLDVNGTARVVGPTFAVGDWSSRSTSVYVRAATGGSELRGFLIGYGASNDGNAGSFTYNPTGNLLNIRSPYNSGTIALSFEGNTNSTQFHNTSGVVHSKIFANTGNWAINTTTDAGFRLDVNGTARVSPIGTSSGTLYITAHGTYVNRGRLSVGGTGDGANTQSGLNFSANSGTGKTYIDGWNDGGSNQYDIVVGSVGSRIQFGTDSASIASAQVTINSTTRGFLPPRMTTTQKNAIATPATGLQVYDTTLNQMSYYNGTTWTNI